MGVFDTLLKQLVAEDMREFAAWLLDTDIDTIEPLTVELLAEPIRADTVFRVRQVDGQELVLHIEFQGRSSRRPMPWRMLDYMVRLVQQYQVPLHSTVLYLDRGAGGHDTGQHQHLNADGSVVLAWTYQVVHLWRMHAEDILALGRRSLLPLVGLTPFRNPSETMRNVIAEIRADPDMQQQSVLLGHLVGLLQDEELIAMTYEVMSDLDLEELKRFPVLWESWLRFRRETKAEAEIEMSRDHILEALVTRLNPPAADYRKVEKVVSSIDDLERLKALFHRALVVDDFATFAAEVVGDEG